MRNALRDAYLEERMDIPPILSPNEMPDPELSEVWTVSLEITGNKKALKEINNIIRNHPDLRYMILNQRMI